jgi:DNA-binding NarL/FixJ family response regulator
MTHSSFASILIVDDYPGWRAQVREILAAHPEWKIISEVCDGREAVREASELQPDIVVLDIALPLMNGIEAAKMIRQKSPKSKIVFLTQDNDIDLRKAALGLGQATYVQKAKAASRLCEAVAASLGGNPTSRPGNSPLQPEWEDQSS